MRGGGGGVSLVGGSLGVGVGKKEVGRGGRGFTSFLTDGDFFFDGQFGHFHAECFAEFLLGGVEDVLELAAAVRCQYWV